MITKVIEGVDDDETRGTVVELSFAEEEAKELVLFRIIVADSLMAVFRRSGNTWLAQTPEAEAFKAP
jgi:hypothetical protein